MATLGPESGYMLLAPTATSDKSIDDGTSTTQGGCFEATTSKSLLYGPRKYILEVSWSPFLTLTYRAGRLPFRDLWDYLSISCNPEIVLYTMIC